MSNPLESLLHDVEHRLHIPGKAQALVAALAAWINGHGGVAGFLDRFRHAGLSDLVDSWLGDGSNRDLTAAQVKSALGADTVSALAGSAHMDASVAGPALAAIIPGLVDHLTPHGAIPHSLPAWLSGVRQEEAVSFGNWGKAGDRVHLLWILLPLLLWMLGSRQCAYHPPAPHAAVPAPHLEAPKFDASAAIEEANRKFLEGLAGLTKGYKVDDLLKVLDLMIVNFATGSAEITADGKALLDKTADALKQAPAGTVIEVSGHTDNVGDPASNLALSDKRAAAVRDYLVSKGVAAKALTAKGYGDTKPVGDNATDEGRFRNRRIDYALAK